MAGAQDHPIFSFFRDCDLCSCMLMPALIKPNRCLTLEVACMEGDAGLDVSVCLPAPCRRRRVRSVWS